MTKKNVLDKPDIKEGTIKEIQLPKLQSSKNQSMDNPSIIINKTDIALNANNLMDNNNEINNSDIHKQILLRILEKNNKRVRKYSSGAHDSKRNGKDGKLLEQFKIMGIDMKSIERFEKESNTNSKKNVEQIKKKYLNNNLNIDTQFIEMKSKYFGNSSKSIYLFPKQNRYLLNSYANYVNQILDEKVSLFNTEVVSLEVQAEGHNYGWSTQWGSDDDVERKTALIYWGYSFIPTETRDYELSALIWFSGNYIIYANDKLWNSKEATAEINVGMGFSQPFLNAGQQVTIVPVWEGGPGDFPPFFKIGDDNIDANNDIHEVQVISHEKIHLEKDIEAAIGCYARIYVYARGDGSLSDINFTGTNNGIGCPYLRID